MDYISLTDNERFVGLREIPIGSKITDEQLDHLRRLDYESNNIEHKMNHYSRFLHEGDYEEFIEVPFMDKTTDEFLEIRVRLLEEQIRILWIEARFMKFWSQEWAENKSLYATKHAYLRMFKGELEKRKTGKYTMQEPNQL